MLEHPGDEGVLDRNELLETRLEAKLYRPEQPADDPDAYFSRAVTLTVVGR